MTVTHLSEQSRFETVVDGVTGYLTYERHGNTVAMTRTVVPPEIGGRGIAGQLTRSAVQWAREQGLAIDPQCSYVRAWLGKDEGS